MSLKNYFFIPFVFCSTGLWASNSFPEEEIVRKVGNFWEAPYSKKSETHKDLFEVDAAVLQETEKFLAMGLTDKERQAQQAKMSHEDGKLAFNIMYYEYVTLLKAGKITRPNEASETQIFEFFEGTKKIESAKKWGVSTYYRDRIVISLSPIYQDSTSSDRQIAEALSGQLNAEKASSDGSLYKELLMAQNDNAASLPPNQAFSDFFGDSKELEEAFAAYDKAIGNGKGLNDMDVHGYNARCKFKATLPLILKSDTMSNANGIKGASTVAAAIKNSAAYGNFAKQKTLDQSISTLLAHLKKNPVEAGETGANVQELFSRIWAFVQYEEDSAHNFFFVMCDNLETKGGCFPGYAGRLADFYIKTARSFLYTQRSFY